MITPTVRKFVKELETLCGNKIAEDAHRLSKGQCGSMEQYNRVVGYRQGMEAAMVIARELMIAGDSEGGETGMEAQP